MNKDFSIRQCTWNETKTPLSLIRRLVFIEEQNVPEELEWDEFDEAAVHVLVLSADNQPVATGRLKLDGHLGRMAVLKPYREQGIGSEILLSLLDVATKNNLKRIYLHAQVSAVGFYEKHGFVCNSDVFLDAGIPHKSMVKKLK